MSEDIRIPNEPGAVWDRSAWSEKKAPERFVEPGWQAITLGDSGTLGVMYESFPTLHDLIMAGTLSSWNGGREPVAAIKVTAEDDGLSFDISVLKRPAKAEVSSAWQPVIYMGNGAYRVIGNYGEFLDGLTATWRRKTKHAVRVSWDGGKFTAEYGEIPDEE